MRYLVRTGYNPLSKIKPSDLLWRRFVGDNSGNLMFAYGAMNALKIDEVEFEYTYSKWHFTDREVDCINEKYDAFILPLADAFRPQFINNLDCLSEMITRLKIPAIVIGVGVRADYEPDFSGRRELDDAAKKFIKAVLNKSAMLGLRGAITADYLKFLGFSAEHDFTPIGCPSLYTYGNAIKTKELREIEHLALNMNSVYCKYDNINNFLQNTAKGVPDYYLVQQKIEEYRDMYISDNFLLSRSAFSGRKSGADSLKMHTQLKNLYAKDKVRYFLDVISWVNFMKSMDLFVGNRFHGSTAAVLAGTPSVMIPFDARTREMVEYHHLTSLKPTEIRQGTSITDYLGKLDFHSFEKFQEENLKHYINFLEANGLCHIFKNQKGYQMGESGLEKDIQSTLSCPIKEYSDIIHCYDSIGTIEKAGRIVMCNLARFKPKNMKITIKRHIDRKALGSGKQIKE